VPTNLTSAKLVEDLLGGIPNEFDELIGQLIVRVSAKIEEKAGLVFAAATRTEYQDGANRDILLLDHGPINAVTSVHEVVYGGASPVETMIPATDYVAAGLRSEGWKLKGHLIRVGASWGRGRRRWKVVYNAGWVDSVDQTVANSIPQGIVEAATEAVARMYTLRDWRGVTDAQLGDYRVRPLSSEQLDRDLEIAIASYRTPRF